MKKFLLGKTHKPTKCANYISETAWKPGFSYFRRIPEGYLYSFDGSTSTEKFFEVTHGIKDISNEPKYNAIILPNEGIPSIPGSTKDNTWLTNDGIALVFLDIDNGNSQGYLTVFDVFAKNDSYDDLDFSSENILNTNITDSNDISEFISDETLTNSLKTSRFFIGQPDSDGILNFESDVKFIDSDEKFHYYTNAIYKEMTAFFVSAIYVNGIFQELVEFDSDPATQLNKINETSSNINSDLNEITNLIGVIS